jgi:hypothetical protein
MSRAARARLTDVTGIVRHRTERAILLDHGGREPAWLPLAQVEVEPNPDGRTVTVTLPEWLATEKGMA